MEKYTWKAEASDKLYRVVGPFRDELGELTRLVGFSYGERRSTSLYGRVTVDTCSHDLSKMTLKHALSLPSLKDASSQHQAKSLASSLQSISERLSPPSKYSFKPYYGLRGC